VSGFGPGSRADVSLHEPERVEDRYSRPGPAQQALGLGVRRRGPAVGREVECGIRAAKLL